MYELKKIHKCQVQIEGPAYDQADIQMEIINNFYVYNVQVEREANNEMELKDHLMETDRQGNLVYTQKASKADPVDSEKSYAKLESLLQLKKLYQNDKLGENKAQATPDETQVDKEAILMEIARFEKDMGLVGDVRLQFAQMMELEYELLKTYTPEVLISH